LLHLSEENALFDDDSDFLADCVDEADLTFWIDPLDGTGGFARGHTEHVTCNIGISVKGRPIFGLIASPFPKFDTKPSLSAVYVGGVQLGMHAIFQSDVNMKCLKCPR